KQIRRQPALLQARDRARDGAHEPPERLVHHIPESVGDGYAVPRRAVERRRHYALDSKQVAEDAPYRLAEPFRRILHARVERSEAAVPRVAAPNTLMVERAH